MDGWEHDATYPQPRLDRSLTVTHFCPHPHTHTQCHHHRPDTASLLLSTTTDCHSHRHCTPHQATRTTDRTAPDSLPSPANTHTNERPNSRRRLVAYLLACSRTDRHTATRRVHCDTYDSSRSYVLPTPPRMCCCVGRNSRPRRQASAGVHMRARTNAHAAFHHDATLLSTPAHSKHVSLSLAGS